MGTRELPIAATSRTAEVFVLGNLVFLWAISLFGNLLLGGALSGIDRSSWSFACWLTSMSLAPALQIPVSLPRFAEFRTRYGGLLLGVDLLIVYAPAATPLHLHGSVGFPLASTLILFRGRLRRLLVAGQLTLLAAVSRHFSSVTSVGRAESEMLTWLVVGVAIGVEVYAVTRLGQVLTLLHATRRQVAATALAVERSRAGRDLHDVLGLSMTAVVLQLELARRAVTRGHCPAEHLDLAAAQTDRALADVRAVTAGERLTTLTTEVEAARAVLSWADIDVVFAVGCGDLPPDTDAALALVLREAVTNVLRHSAATRCVVTATRVRGEIVLAVENDGADHGADPGADPEGHTGGEGSAARKAGGAGGSGLANLATRLAAVGGTIRSERADDARFVVTARVTPPSEGRFRTEASRRTAWLGTVLAIWVTTLCIRPTFWPYIPNSMVFWQILLTCSAHLLLFHICRPRPGGARPPLLKSALTAQAALAAGPVLLGWQWFFPVFHPLAAALLFVYRRPLAVAAFGLCAVVDTAVLYGVLRIDDFGSEAFRSDGFTGMFTSALLQSLYAQMLLTALFVLAQLQNELTASRAELARAAVAAERARFGRDLRDRLGSKLFTVARSVARARAAVGTPGVVEADLADLAELARHAAHDIRAAARGVPATHTHAGGHESLTPGS